MKKKMAIFMAVVCLVCLGGGMTVCAQEYLYCPYCASHLNSSTQHLGDWNNVRLFKKSDSTGQAVFCYEHYSVDKVVKYCPKGCGVIWEGEPIKTSTHSVPQCPYNK